MPRSPRRLLSALLVLTLLAPNASLAQPPPSTQGAPGTQPVPVPPVPVPSAPVLAEPMISRITAGSDYRLGPGDTVEVILAGRVDVSRHLALVSADGNITIPPVGQIAVGGLTVLEAQRRVGELARPLFRFLDLTVSLIATRSFEVTVAGEVERPGTLLLSATQRVHQVILSAGGVTPRGSLRNVILSRNGREERRVDLLRFLLAGDLENNPYVTEGVSVEVPPRGPAVALAGSVVRPGEYEIGRDSSLRALLQLTGGLQTESAAAEARMTRIGADGKKATMPLDLTAALKPPADVQLRAGDVVYVPPLAVIQDVVEVRGAFNGAGDVQKTTVGGRPSVVQRFELAAGDRIRDVVSKAGGPAPFADLRLAYIERRGDSGPRQTIPVDLRRLLVEKDEVMNILMQNGDVVVVPALEDKVYVLGEVRTPGAVDFRPSLTSREYIALAGGPGSRAKDRATTVTFPNGRTYRVSESPPIEPGVVITVPEVAVKWWQDYANIANTIASLVTAYTGLYILFGGAREIQRLNQ